MTDVKAFLAEKAGKTEAALAGHFARWNGMPERLREAMEYSLFAGGKRLRPALALGAAEIVGGDDERALPAACAVEMIHTYSLMHDDLPAIDDDDLRRGRPTSHKIFGEAIAILAGDALLTMAFEVAAQSGDARVIADLAGAAGAEGMVGGQVIDLMSEDEQLTVEELQRLHACKTGALIRASVRAGVLLGNGNEDALTQLTQYGEHIGLAFQIADDILNVTGSEAAMGKPVGSDVAHHKSTYPALLGLERARELADSCVTKAVETLEVYGDQAAAFRALARYIVDRDC